MCRGYQTPTPKRFSFGKHMGLVSSAYALGKVYVKPKYEGKPKRFDLTPQEKKALRSQCRKKKNGYDVWRKGQRIETFIYGLKDPRDGKLGYVGKSNWPRYRLLEHLDELGVNPGKTRWLDELKAKGLKPEIIIIEKVSLETWKERERYWIKHYKANHKLTNIGLGGEGS